MHLDEVSDYKSLSMKFTVFTSLFLVNTPVPHFHALTPVLHTNFGRSLARVGIHDAQEEISKREDVTNSADGANFTINSKKGNRFQQNGNRSFSGPYCVCHTRANSLGYLKQIYSRLYIVVGL